MTATMPGTGPGTTTVVALRPRMGSANIRTWIGFKEFMALSQEAVLEWFRQRDLGPQRLFHEHGLELRVRDSSVLLPTVLQADDVVRGSVERTGPDRFSVRLSTGAGERSVLRGKVTVALEPAAFAETAVRTPDGLGTMVADGPAGHGTPEDPGGAFGWEAPVRYFQCHYSSEAAHAAYVALMEEAVDRYLHHVGLSVPALLDERGWIPVVSRARVRATGPARMDDVVRTTFAVDDIVGGRAFDGRMTCTVTGPEGTRTVASGSILHGYAISRGPAAGELAELDGPTADALQGGAAR